MKIPATLLLSYQMEYEATPDFTIEDLCIKYDVKTKDLKGHTKWTKQSEQPPVISEVIDKPIVKPRDIVPKTTEELLADVEDFKHLAVAHAVKFMREDARFAEVKEFKDMVAIVDSIEKSYKDTKEQGPTVNILIQNLAEKFKDDC